MRRRRLFGAAATVLLVPLIQVLPATSAGAAPPTSVAPNDVREFVHKEVVLNGKKVATPRRYEPKARAQTRAAAETPPVGTVRQWPAFDILVGDYLKDYTLRGVGNKIEVWVANDTAFPAGDCRLQIPDSTTVTDAQVAGLIDEFDNNMFPKETAAFSTPPDRDGTNALIPGDFTGEGDNTVALIDNVREENFYDFPANSTYIAGFFASGYNEVTDRNVMTIDAFDWAHRTGTNPPDEPTDDPCTSRPARPLLYEATFAHEWQHLLHYYTDPFESTWINEGLSDFAQTLVGYVDTRLSVFEPDFDGHVTCFQGFGIVQTPFNPNPRDCGGPENSLNLWNEGDNPDKVLADYGNAYAFMQFLFDRYGIDFMTRLHNDAETQGLANLAAALEAEGVSPDVFKVLHDFQTMVLVDRLIGDSRRGTILGVPRARVTTPSLRSSLNFDNPDVNDDPGAAPNGADFVQLQGANGTVLSGRDLRSLSFEGVRTLPSLPLKWTVVSNDPDRPGNAVLFSGNESALDAAAVISVTVPTADPTLRFLAKYGAEFGFDYGYVMVSTDGGATYTAVAGDKTVEAPLGPGLNGDIEGFQPHTFDLSAFAGQTVLLNFRYVSDGSVNNGGLLIDDVTLGDTQISDGSNMDAFDSPTEIRPIEVDNWNLRLIGIDERHSLALQLEINGKFSVQLNRLALLFLSLFPKVVAVVAYDEPTEQVLQYAPYTLTVNGVVQPGGGGGTT